ncbi:hypothetical protein BO83DRAFT_140731 [Aspergillus eucalypticola CBS 122712]|uniref:Uncharacterized protein n=1 Tax=Aspergillus eucalypticola (strain CBS 122712 / IBT 29274) TaxID=1448314 RepID=A0A317UV04_ASPEC|nr:uncharacterized protein BO83DRAFT_140731 [Aspergillus eucalypticola CBS 122712]PWY64352.1 hypothetical protein BO83DRAFT_140731 [Aspergillus eucalypticola CBS 122712]
MTSGFLSYYFPIDQGFIVAPTSTGSKCSPGCEYIIRQIQPHSSEGRKIVGHVVVRSEVDDSLQGRINRLQQSIQHRALGVEGCWAVLVHYLVDRRSSMPFMYAEIVFKLNKC